MALSISYENSRPTPAPICATSLDAVPSRSRRAISDACRDTGTACAARAVVDIIRVASSGPSTSATAFVSSSMNNGTPSVRWTIASTTSSGSPLVPRMRRTKHAHSPRSSRWSASKVTWAGPVHADWNSGRKVMSSSSEERGAHFTTRSSSSRDVGSIQWASSNSIRTGCRRARVESCRNSASNVFSFLRCGDNAADVKRPLMGTDSSSARSATSSSGGIVGASSSSSFTSLFSAVSSRSNPAARSSWLTIGCSALSL